MGASLNQSTRAFVCPLPPPSPPTTPRKNGARAREAVRDAHAGGDWGAFGALLAGGEPGNGGRLALHLPMEEILPPIETTGTFRVGAGGEQLDGAAGTTGFGDDAAEARAVVEVMGESV